MVKEPRPGRVKTRLGNDIGMVPAAWWFRHQCSTLLRRIRDPRWQVWLAVSPDTEGLTSRVWPADLPRVAQGSGDLGHRMARLLRSVPPGPALVVGADIPNITRAHLAEAFEVLGRNDGVIGPSVDGGYWCVGLRRTRAVAPWLFDGVRWSTQYARADTMTTMPKRTALIRTLRDVDTAEDL